MITLGLADIYINSGGSTYKWDTCAPHSIIAAVGGGVIEFKQFVGGDVTKDGGGKYKEICYNVHEGGNKANGNGILVYRHPESLEVVKELLHNIK